MCDLVIEAWEAWLATSPANARAPVAGWLAVLEMFRPDAPAQLLGFRFMYHQVSACPATRCLGPSSFSTTPAYPRPSLHPASPLPAHPKTRPRQTPAAPPAPPALYLLAAQLVTAGRVALEQLLAYLSPDDGELAARFASAAAAVRTEVEAYGKVDLTSSEGTTGGAPRGGVFSGAALDLDAGRFDSLLLAHLSRPSGEGAEGKEERGEGSGAGPNQKLGLVEALLAVGDWDKAKLLMQQLKVGGGRTRVERFVWGESGLVGKKERALCRGRCLKQFLFPTNPHKLAAPTPQLLGIPAAADPGVCAALCAIVAARTDPLHSQLLPEGPLGPSRLEAYLDAVDRWQRGASAAGGGGDGAARAAPPAPPAPPLDSDAFDALEALGLYAYRDPALLARVLRVLQHHVASYCCHGEGRAAAGAVLESAEGDDGAAPGGVGVSRVYRLIAQAVLPSLAMVPANFALANAVWAVMRLLPFPARFAIYRQAQEVWAETPLLQVTGGPPPLGGVSSARR